MTRRTTPAKGKKINITVGLDPEEIEVVDRVMAHHRMGQAAAVRLLIRNGAAHTITSPPQEEEHA
jgi:hypothetical protein